MDLQWVLEAYLQANTNNKISNMDSRGKILDDAMNDLAKHINVGWYRSEDGVWHFDRQKARVYEF